MAAFDTAGNSAADPAGRRERRLLTTVLACLLVATVAVCPLAFGNLPMLFLLCVPFALTTLAVAVLAPLAVSPEQARASESRALATVIARRTAADQHHIRTPRADTLPPDDRESLALAVAAAATHGIHFGCAHLSDEDFLQAFQACEIPAAQFRHGDHLRYTAMMIWRLPGGLVYESVAQQLRSFLRQVCGSEALFHATRTHAWVALLRALPRASFPHLLEQYGHVLHGQMLSEYYSPALLESAAARQRPIAPDLQPLPRPQAPISSRT